MVKRTSVASESESKEPIVDRIFELIESRHYSLSEAARAWGINKSTIANYYKRAEQKPVPRMEQLKKIAQYENVSLQWLLTGEGEEHDKNTKFAANESKRNAWRQRLIDDLELLDDQTIECLYKQLSLNGLGVLLYLLDDKNIKLLQMPDVLKEQILGHKVTTSEAALEAQDQRESGTDDAVQTRSDGLKKQAG